MTATSKISLDGKVVLITGASRGIGEAIAHASFEAGAKVVLASRKQPDLDRVAGEIDASGERVLASACHTGKADNIAALFDAAIEKFGQVDALINNAATNPYFGPMIDCSDKAFDKTFEVNTRGYFFVAREFIKRLRARKGTSGSIVNVASIAGMRAAPMQGVYGMTKAAVISMTQTMAYELGSSGIRVNAICPGLVETRFAAALVSNPTIHDQVVGRTPLGRHGQPPEIAGAAVYLASDASSFMTGQAMVIDGGFTVN